MFHLFKKKRLKSINSSENQTFQCCWYPCLLEMLGEGFQTLRVIAT